MRSDEGCVDRPVGVPIRLLLEALDPHEMPAVRTMDASILRGIKPDVGRYRSGQARNRRVGASLVLRAEPRRLAVPGASTRVDRQLRQLAPLHDGRLEQRAQNGISGTFVEATGRGLRRRPTGRARTCAFSTCPANALTRDGTPSCSGEGGRELSLHTLGATSGRAIQWLEPVLQGLPVLRVALQRDLVLQAPDHTGVCVGGPGSEVLV